MESPPRWFQELPLLSRIVIGFDDLPWEAHLAGLVFVLTLALMEVSASNGTAPGASAEWAIIAAGELVSGVIASVLLLRRGSKRTEFRLRYAQLRAGLYQLGVRRLRRYLRRYPERKAAALALEDAAYEVDDRFAQERARFAIGLLGFCLGDFSDIDRLVGFLRERGLIEPSEVVRLLAATEDAPALADGAL